jgi:hypothetical protein
MYQEAKMADEKLNVPDGYMKDHKGSLIPNDMVKPIDKMRDELVRDIVNAALRASEILTKFKASAMGDIEAFIQLSAEKYEVKVGGDKGNVTLFSFDGEYKVMRAISDRLTFDERLQVAKALIDECINEWSDGVRPEIKVLVDDAFQVDKQGKINTERVLRLRRLDIKADKWLKAMDAIGDSIQVASSKKYIRIYQRQKSGDYRQIDLDLAAV